MIRQRMRITAVVLICAMLAAAAGCTGYNNSKSYSEGNIRYALDTSGGKHAMAQEYNWDGGMDEKSLTIDIPDEVDDGYKVEDVGGFIGIGVPTKFYILCDKDVCAQSYTREDRVIFEGTDPATYDFPVSFEKIVFTVNLGKYVKKVNLRFDPNPDPVEVKKDDGTVELREVEGENQQIAIRQADGSVIFYEAVLYFNVSEENESYYSEDGQLYKKGASEVGWWKNKAEGSVTNLMEGITAKNKAGNEEAATAYSAELSDFALRLFNTCRQGDGNTVNTLISPLSVLLALSMTANGADGETLAKMEETLGLTKDKLNEFASAYMNLLAQGNKDAGKLELANSIWFTADPRFTVDKDFLQANADYYRADIYKAPFDASTLKAINNWVNEKTEGMIPKILDNIPAEAVMYLVNALAFDAEWTQPYFDFQVADNVFTTADGREEKVPYLYCIENTYLKDDKASGFIKYYKGYNYAFLALLPDEGVSVDEYLDSLDGKRLSEIIANKQGLEVRTSMPKFESEYSTEMSEQLSKMGMSAAFDPKDADFAKIGTSSDGNIAISRVIHKTFIAVDENGTKAGAATLVEMNDGTAIEEEEPKIVYLTRPFVYMLLDCRTASPFFVGVMRDLEAKQK